MPAKCNGEYGAAAAADEHIEKGPEGVAVNKFGKALADLAAIPG